MVVAYLKYSTSTNPKSLRSTAPAATYARLGVSTCSDQHEASSPLPAQRSNPLPPLSAMPDQQFDLAAPIILFVVTAKSRDVAYMLLASSFPPYPEQPKRRFPPQQSEEPKSGAQFDPSFENPMRGYQCIHKLTPRFTPKRRWG